MSAIFKYRLKIFLAATSLWLLLPGCSGDDDPIASRPPQSYEQNEVAVTLSHNMITRAIGKTADGKNIKTEWEEGDKIYFSYVKTFAEDEDIINVFHYDKNASSSAETGVFVCKDFIQPRGIAEGKFIYVGERDVKTLSDLKPHNESLDSQIQTGNDNYANIVKYLHLETPFVSASSPEELNLQCYSLRNRNSVVSLRIKRPEGYESPVGKVILTMHSDNVFITGNGGKSIEMILTDTEWEDGYITVHIVVCMEGLINDGNKCEIRVSGEDGSYDFSRDFSAKQWQSGYHYTSFVSSDPTDYEITAGTDIPGYIDGGEAF